jgi:superfamily II DNA helicase RecQ
MQQYRTFFVPLTDDGEAQEALNAFLRSRRVLAVERVFTSTGWAFCVEWMEGSKDASRNPPKVDYREVLTPEQFAVFSRLRNRRKELADRDGVQVYAVMTNEQLAEMVRMEVGTLEGLRKIDGVGQARSEKYGEALLAAMREEKASKDGH